MIRKPPIPPTFSTLAPEVKTYLDAVHLYLTDAYNILIGFDLGKVKVSSGVAVPTNGADGDLYIQQDGVNTSLWLNINGVWSQYVNP